MKRRRSCNGWFAEPACVPLLSGNGTAGAWRDWKSYGLGDNHGLICTDRDVVRHMQTRDEALGGLLEKGSDCSRGRH